MTTALAAAFDPLLASVSLPYTAVYHPKGFPVAVRTNSPLVIEAADASWAGAGRRFDERPLEIRCLVTGGRASRRPPRAPVPRAQGNLLVSVASIENFCCCDLEKGLGAAWVTRDAAARQEYFRYHFLEAMVYAMLDTLHLVAVHAACVALDGRGVLLAGDSGAGKSSLAYACARKGWTYVSDDASSLVRRGRGRTVIGNPRLFRFRENAGAIFPEFRGFAATRRGNGKPTVEVLTASLPGLRQALESHVDFLVFLNRSGPARREAHLHPISPEEALSRLFTSPWPAELRGAGERRTAVERLLAAKALELRYGALDSAVNLLEKLVRGGLQ
ncbi:MAG: HPr kinase/phosphorylase [Acidobacteriota bacterium]